MYFEPAKKTYYRFPSSNNVNNFDSRFYFPETPNHSTEDTHIENNATHSSSQQDHYLGV